MPGKPPISLKSAALSRQMTGQEQRRTRMQVIAGTVKAYYGAVLAAESLKTADQALRSAEADLERAEALRKAGLSTDVDVLSIRVHVAAVTEQRIQRTAELDVAKSAFNDVLGVPLDTPYSFTTALAPLDSAGHEARRDGTKRAGRAPGGPPRNTWRQTWQRPGRTRPGPRCCRRSPSTRHLKPTASSHQQGWRQLAGLYRAALEPV